MVEAESTNGVAALQLKVRTQTIHSEICHNKCSQVHQLTTESELIKNEIDRYEVS